LKGEDYYEREDRWVIARNDIEAKEKA